MTQPTNWQPGHDDDAFWTREGAQAHQSHRPSGPANSGYAFYGQTEPAPTITAQPLTQPRTRWTQPEVGYTTATTGRELVPAPYQSPVFWPGREHPNASTSLLLGIFGLVAFPPLGIIALVMAMRGRAEMTANPGAYTGRDVLTAGLVLGALGTGLTIMGGLLLGMMFLMMMLGI